MHLTTLEREFEMNNIVVTLPAGVRYSKLRPLRDYVAANFSQVVIACYTTKAEKVEAVNGLLVMPASKKEIDIRLNILRPRAFKMLGSFVFIDIDCAHCDDLARWLKTNQTIPIASSGFLYLPKVCRAAYEELWKKYSNEPMGLDFWTFVERELCIPQF